MTEKQEGQDQHQVSVLQRCPLRESWLYIYLKNNDCVKLLLD